MTPLRPIRLRGFTRDDVDARAREARKRLDRLFHDPDYPHDYGTMDLLTIGQAAEQMAEALERVEERRTNKRMEAAMDARKDTPST